MKETLGKPKRYCHLCNPERDIARPTMVAKEAVLQSKISKLLGQGLSAAEISDQLDLNLQTVYDQIGAMAEFLRKSENARDEAVISMLSIKRETLRMAFSDWVSVRKKATNPDGTIDQTQYDSLYRQIITIGQAAQSLENTLARLGLIPPEPRRLDVSGQLDTHQEIVQIIIERTERLLEGEQNGR